MNLKELREIIIKNKENIDIITVHPNKEVVYYGDTDGFRKNSKSK